jgi:hypothetical protein
MLTNVFPRISHLLTQIGNDKSQLFNVVDLFLNNVVEFRQQRE